MASETSVPRGRRNNNPLNIRVGNDWQGEMPRNRRSAPQAAEREFEVFETPAAGFRAGALLLLGYQRRYGLRSIEALIRRFAPPNENKTEAYIDFVAGYVGVDRSAPIDLTDYRTAFRTLKAMAHVEN